MYSVSIALLLLSLCLAVTLAAAQRIDVVVQSGHANAVERIAFTSDGKLLASVDRDGAIKLWDLATFKEIATIRTDLNLTAATPNGLAFSKDNKSLIVPAVDRSVRVYDVATGRRIALLAKTGNEINLAGAALNVERMLGAQLGENDDIQVRNLDTGKQLFAYSFPSAPERLYFPKVQNFAFSPNGALLVATASGGRIALVNTTTGKASQIIKNDEPDRLAFSPDGKAFAVTEKDKSGAVSIVVRSLPSGRVTKKIAVKTGEVASLAWSRDFLVAIVTIKNETRGEEEYAIRIWNLTTTGEPREIKFDYTAPFGELTDAGFSPEGNVLAVGAGVSLGGRIHLFDVASGTELAQLQRQSSYIHGIQHLKNGRLVVDSQHLRFFDLKNIKQLSDESVAEYAVSSSGKRLAAYNTFSHTFEVTDLETNQEVAKLAGNNFNMTDYAVVFSPDERFLLVHASPVFSPPPESRLLLFDAVTGALLFTFPDNAEIVAFKPDGKSLAYVTKGNANEQKSTIKVWNVDQRTLVQTINLNGVVSALAFDPVADDLSVASYTTREIINHYSLNRIRVSDGQVTMTVADPGVIDSLVFSPAGDFLASESSEQVRVWNAEGKLINVLEGHTTLVEYLSFAPDGKTLATASQDGEIIFWDYKKAQLISRLIVVGESDYIFVTPDNYYFASRKGAAAAVALREELQAFPFEQFDIRFNRPDLVLKAMGSTDTALIQVYAKAYQQRLAQYGLTEADFSGAIALPDLSISSNEIPRITSNKDLSFQIKAHDSSFGLAQVNVYVNDVPVYGSKGLTVAEKVTTLARRIGVELSPGNNRVQVSVTNTHGVESLRQTFRILYEGPAPRPELYVLAIGVSKYADESLNLTYPAQDAETIIKLFEDRAAQKEMAIVIGSGNPDLQERPKSFYKVHPLKIVNEQATVKNITAARTFLEQARTEDEIVVFISGHGLLDENNNYFFGTHDIEPRNPASHGLSYTTLETLLDGLRARRKLLLIDTCHAGELAKDDREKLKITEAVKSEDGFIRSFDVAPKDIRLRPIPGSFQNSLALVEELFADLRFGNGISVVSASGGLQYAFESARWSGGVFAYALRLGLGDMQADADRDGKITSSELRDFVIRKVPELTQAKQKPTYRRESVAFDDRIF